MGPIRCPETSVKDYRSTLRNNPEERRSYPHRDGSLTSRSNNTEQILEAKDGMSFAREMRVKRELPEVQERSPGRIDRRHLTCQVPRPELVSHYTVQVTHCALSVLRHSICCVVTLIKNRVLSWLNTPSGPRSPL